MLDLRCLIGFSVLLWNDLGLGDSLFKTEKTYRSSISESWLKIPYKLNVTCFLHICRINFIKLYNNKFDPNLLNLDEEDIHIPTEIGIINTIIEFRGKFRIPLQSWKAFE